MMEHKQEQKSNNHCITCKATQNYSSKRTLYYIEKTTPLTKDHVKLYNELRLYVDNVLSRRIPWVLTALEPQLLTIVPSNTDRKLNQNRKASKQYATAEMYQYLSMYSTESALIRGIVGSDFRIDDAKLALLDTVQWRVSSKIDYITPDMFKSSIKSKIVYSMDKRDKKGHLICYFKVLEVVPEDSWQIVRACIWTLEKGVKMAAQKGLHQMLWMIDIEHLKYATMPPVQVLKQIAHILQRYYPERTYRAYVIFSPLVFRMIWKMISGLLTENTKAKIIVPGYEESAKYATFKENIDKCNLDKRFGGDLELKYNYQWEVQRFNTTNRYTK